MASRSILPRKIQMPYTFGFHGGRIDIFTEIPLGDDCFRKDLVPVTVMGSSLINEPKAFLFPADLVHLLLREMSDNSIITGISFAGNRWSSAF